ncbi:hypothetical protein [Streptomyces xiamenensis]|uniref:hypothetical protein n=1 Tax=Streptomyces xiamenensis TaxID=408015 RepID=UPI0037CFC661
MTGLIASSADGWWYSLAVAAGLGTAACRLPRARARISVLCMAVVPLCLVPLVANTTAGGDTSQMTPCTYAVIAGSIAGTAASVLEAARAPVPAATPPTRAHVPLLPTVEETLRAAGFPLTPETVDAGHVQAVADRYGTIIVRWTPGAAPVRPDQQTPAATLGRGPVATVRRSTTKGGAPGDFSPRPAPTVPAGARSGPAVASPRVSAASCRRCPCVCSRSAISRSAMTAGLISSGSTGGCPAARICRCPGSSCSLIRFRPSAVSG